MSDDRTTGAGREMLGAAERRAGSVVGSDRTVSDGALEQAAGAVQHGYGMLKDAAAVVADQAPDAVSDALNQGRRLARRADEAVRNNFGESGPIYVLAGAVAFLAAAVLYAGRER